MPTRITSALFPTEQGKRSRRMARAAEDRLNHFITSCAQRCAVLSCAQDGRGTRRRRDALGRPTSTGSRPRHWGRRSRTWQSGSGGCRGRPPPASGRSRIDHAGPASAPRRSQPLERTVFVSLARSDDRSVLLRRASGTDPCRGERPGQCGSTECRGFRIDRSCLAAHMQGGEPAAASRRLPLVETRTSPQSLPPAPGRARWRLVPGDPRRPRCARALRLGPGER